MLTDWKQIATSFEVPISDGKKSQHVNGSISQAEKELRLNGEIGAHFVQPLPSQNSFYLERVNPASKSAKKRRRMSGRLAVEESLIDVEPSLCITSSHRVAFVGKATNPVENDGYLESKTGAYVARPGSASSFRLGNAQPSTYSFAGMASSGAQYDPSSNLLCAIRNDGAEIAIWSAVSSSVLSGPDERSKGIGRDKGSDAFDCKSKPIHERKRKAQQHENGGTDGIVSELLPIPHGKRIATLTPFSIPSPKDVSSLVAFGAGGCCTDGSIWIAVQFARDSTGLFRMLIVDGSSVVTSDTTNGASKRGRRKTKPSHVSNDDAVLVSRVSGAVDPSQRQAIALTFSSVLRSGGGQITVRSHQVKVVPKESEIDVSVTRYSEKHVLSLGSDEVAATINSHGSLCIVHRENDESWVLSSSDLSESKGSDLGPILSSFPLVSPGLCGASVFSFGSLSKSTVALLMVGSSKERPRSRAYNLRLLDVERKAELHSMTWLDGEGAGESEMSGKMCRGMLTNELDGSLAILASPTGSAGCLVLVTATLAPTLPQKGSDKVSRDSSTLASSLRNSSTTFLPEVSGWPSMPRSADLSKIVVVDDKSNATRKCSVDNAIAAACKLLADSAKDLIDSSSKSGNALLVNGKKRKVSSKSKHTSPVKWSEVYRNCSTLIADAEEGNSAPTKPLRNGSKPQAATQVDCNVLPTQVIHVAFRETTRILTSLTESRGSIVQDVSAVLSDILKRNIISARKSTYDQEVFVTLINHGASQKLNLINIVLKHVPDIPEGLLVTLFHLVLRSATVEEASAYYQSGSFSKGSKLSKKYRDSPDGDVKDQIAQRLLAEVVVEFALRIVTYSTCNHSFLSKALREGISSAAEVETMLLTLAKLLGRMHLDEFELTSSSCRVSLPMGAIQWIKALTDAHMGTILKIKSEGGLVLDRVQRSIRSAKSQSEYASEIVEILAQISSSETQKRRKAQITSLLHDNTEPYTVERLTF